MSFKAAIKSFVPPVVLDLLMRARGRETDFAGDYRSWEAAAVQSTGYSSEEILRRVVAATRKVENGEAVYERDSVLFDAIEYSWPLLACLLQVALQCGYLRVVDFGGSLGSTWRQNRKYLGALNIPLAWNVVEQEGFVLAGREHFENQHLHFARTIKEASQAGVDVVLFSSSLSYLPDPLCYLREAAATPARYLIIDRLPTIAGDRDRIAVQKVSEPIYPATYPVRLFSRQRLMQHWLSDWRLIEEWRCDLQPDPALMFNGFFMEKR